MERTEVLSGGKFLRGLVDAFNFFAGFFDRLWRFVEPPRLFPNWIPSSPRDEALAIGRHFEEEEKEQEVSFRDEII